MAHHEHFLHLPQYIQLYLIIELLFLEILHAFANKGSKLFAANLLYVGKG